MARVADLYMLAAVLNISIENELTYHWGALGGGATTPCRCGRGCGTSLGGSANRPLLLSWKREMQTLPPFLGPPSLLSNGCVQPGPPASTHPHLCRMLPCPPPPQRQHRPPCCKSFFCTPTEGGEMSQMLAGPKWERQPCNLFATLKCTDSIWASMTHWGSWFSSRTSVSSRTNWTLNVQGE